jgi:hypothetical protein
MHESLLLHCAIRGSLAYANALGRYFGSETSNDDGAAKLSDDADGSVSLQATK